jgi:superoxide reductase
MDRRTFVKGTVLAASTLALGKAFASGELLRLQNRDDPSVGEQKHVPGIEAPANATKGEWFDVKVKVGYMMEHPSTPDHWITYVKLLADGQEIARTDRLVGGVSSSSATFRIKLEATIKLEAIENCNLHGTWISDPVTVTV